MMLATDLSALIDACTKITDAADAEISRIYAKHTIACTTKEDCSPLTEADLASHHIIVDALHDLTPDIPVVSEEGADAIDVNGLFWLVDPLDGTKEFISRNGEFTVNIALIKNNLPILGVVSAPVLNLTYAGIAGHFARKRGGAEWGDISVCTNALSPRKIVGSKSHGSQETNEWVSAHYPDAEFCGIGSSLKFCLIAEGAAHAYPRFGRTMEWDTAAGHAILSAAGGSIVKRDGTPLTYGKPIFENPHFIARHKL
jgi:3'(2'), 5'-bisphosphate nucleotidase